MSSVYGYLTEATCLVPLEVCGDPVGVLASSGYCVRSRTSGIRKYERIAQTSEHERWNQSCLLKCETAGLRQCEIYVATEPIISSELYRIEGKVKVCQCRRNKQE